MLLNYVCALSGQSNFKSGFIVSVLMQQWTQLYGFASNRFQQSQQLCKTYGDLTKVKATVSEVVKDMITGSFDELIQLETASKQLQVMHFCIYKEMWTLL